MEILTKILKISGVYVDNLQIEVTKIQKQPFFNDKMEIVSVINVDYVDNNHYVRLSNVTLIIGEDVNPRIKSDFGKDKRKIDIRFVGYKLDNPWKDLRTGETGHCYSLASPLIPAFYRPSSEEMIDLYDQLFEEVSKDSLTSPA